MGYVLGFLRSGVWASITGGWYYDPSLGHFANVFHLYTWLFFLCAPLIFHVALPATVGYGIFYVLLVGLVCGAIKLTNYRLHTMFDSQQPSQENDDNKVAEDNGGGNSSDLQNAAEAPQPCTVDPSIQGTNGDSRATERRGSPSSTHSLEDLSLKPVDNPKDLAEADNSGTSSSAPQTRRTAATGTAEEVQKCPSPALESEAATLPYEDETVPRNSGAEAYASVCSTTGLLSADSPPDSRQQEQRSNVLISSSSSARVSHQPSHIVVEGFEVVPLHEQGAANSAAVTGTDEPQSDSATAASLKPMPVKEIEEQENELPETQQELPRPDADALTFSSALLALQSSGPVGPVAAQHMATSYDDTTVGALHFFQDENGEWHSYVFGDDSGGGVFDITRTLRSQRASGGDDANALYSSMESSSLRRRHRLQERRLEYPHPFLDSSVLEAHYSVEDNQRQPTPQWPFQPLPFVKRTIQLQLDRLKLTYLLDRDRRPAHSLISILLAMASAAMGYWLLSRSFYTDFAVFCFCFVLASAHYSLVKSVQPDPASPTQDDNRLTALSRAIFFILIAALVLILDAQATNNPSSVTVYGLNIHSDSVFRFVGRSLQIFLLCFPVIFILGLLPQVNTFMLYCLEQIDIHALGGNGTSSLKGAVFALTRALIVLAIVYGFAYGAGKSSSPKDSASLSAFMALVISLSYHLSRVSSNPSIMWLLAKNRFHSVPDRPTDKLNPFPQQLQETVIARQVSDIVVCLFVAVVAFAVHITGLFTVSKLLWVMCSVAAVYGFVIHYFVPQLRKHQPWLCLVSPVLRSAEYSDFEVHEPAKMMWFEKLELFGSVLERFIVYPMLFASALTCYSNEIFDKFGTGFGAMILSVCGVKMMRGAFMDVSLQFVATSFTALFFNYDYRNSSETFPIDFFFAAIFLRKVLEFSHKMKFVLTYIAPWQLPWGSAFHAVAQPLSIPHSAMLFVQTLISSIFSTPLSPLVGSAIFLTSYARPIKFWEREYSTRRVDSSNTRLSSQLERNPGIDDNNLNSIFYEHLTRSLRQSLCGDITLGRWGRVQVGDFFILASDNLNALVHVVEMGNGHVTFQLRGLEFRGTYCQQREVEAINEDMQNDNCCCCSPGHPPGMLSVNLAFGQRWLAWEVSRGRFVLEGYSITANGAASMLNAYDMRKILVSYYVKAIIFYTVDALKLDEWLNSPVLDASLYQPLRDSTLTDLDTSFSARVDEDYDFALGGLTRRRFFQRYGEWLQYCAKQKDQSLRSDEDSRLVILCFALSLLARRVLNTAANNETFSVDSFLYGLHALFKGDVRITNTKDEWVFSDMDFLHLVIKPAIRMSLKLHQDHFLTADEYDDPQVLHVAVNDHRENMVIAHESDPAWRQAVLDNVPSLLALRHVMDEGINEYKIVMLNKRFLSFRVIKVNEECVRGLWAGQQYELIFLRNSNSERGSIQNARQALRNFINSSCDIGYPIYVSPLTTSYLESNQQIADTIGPPLSFSRLGGLLRSLWQHLLCNLSRNSASASRATVASRTIAESTGAAGPSVRSQQSSGQALRHGTAHLNSGSGSRTRLSWYARGTSSLSVGGEDDSSAGAGFRLTDSLNVLSSTFTGEQQNSSSMLRDRSVSKVSTSSHENSDVRHVVVSGSTGPDGVSLGTSSMAGSSVAGVSAVSVSQVANAGSLAGSSHAPTADSSSFVSGIGGGDGGSRGDALSRAMHFSQTGSLTTSFSMPVSDVAFAGSLAGSHTAAGDAANGSVASGVTANMSHAECSSLVDERSQAEASSRADNSSLSRTDVSYRADNSSRAACAVSERSLGLSSAVSDFMMTSSLAESNEPDVGSTSRVSEAARLTDSVSQVLQSSQGGSLHSAAWSRLLGDEAPGKFPAGHQFQVLNTDLVYRKIAPNDLDGLELRWPSEELRSRCLPSYWETHSWSPKIGMVGQLVHAWLPVEPGIRTAKEDHHHFLKGHGAVLVLESDHLSESCVVIDQAGAIDLGAML